MQLSPQYIFFSPDEMKTCFHCNSYNDGYIPFCARASSDIRDRKMRLEISTEELSRHLSVKPRELFQGQRKNAHHDCECDVFGQLIVVEKLKKKPLF